MQSYEVDADKEYVIRGNSVVLKCKIPSFVADFVAVTMWEDSEGNNFHPSDSYGTYSLTFWFDTCMLCKFSSCHYISFATFPKNVKVALKPSALTEDFFVQW